MDMDDLLAGFSDEDEDSIMGGKVKKTAPKQQKEDTTVKKQRSTEDTPQKPTEPDGTSFGKLTQIIIGML